MVVVLDIRVLRVSVKAADCRDKHDHRKNHGKTGREHRNAVFLVHFHNLLIVLFLVVGILLLQLFHSLLVFLHLVVLLTHRDSLIHVERQNDELQNQREYDNTDADDADTRNQPFDNRADPAERNIVRLAEVK